MKPIECMGSFSEWDKKVRSILLNEILVDKGISFVVNNPLYDEERKDKRCKKTPDEILEDLKKRLKRNDDWRTPRKIHLEDLYSLCKITEKPPNYFLLKNAPEESDSKEFLEYLIKDQKTLGQFIGQNITLRQFFEFFGLSNPKLPKIKLPEDEVFLNLFQAQIITYLPRTFKITKKSVDGAVEEAKSNSGHKESHRYDFSLKKISGSDDRRKLFIEIIKHAASKNPRAAKIKEYLNDQYMTNTWTVSDTDKVENKFPPLFDSGEYKSWNAKNRFIVSVNAFLLLCVVAAVVETVRYQGNTGITFNPDVYNKYIDENIDISNLINELFIRSFWHLGSNVFCANHHKMKAPITISKNQKPVKPAPSSDDTAEELDEPSKERKGLDNILPDSVAYQDNSI